jgi:class 3 adenylate cyclase
VPLAATESLAALTGASRTSIWQLTARGEVLRCADSYERDGQGHAGGFELHRRELPLFFELLHGKDELTVSDAAADRRCGQFYNVIMRSLGSRALTAIPLCRGDRPAGVICLEDAKISEGMQEFLRTVAGMLSPALKAAESSSDPAAEPSSESARLSAQASTGDKAPGPRIFSADLGPSPAERATLGAGYYPTIGAMVLQLSGTIALARKTAADSFGAAAWIAELLQQEAAEHDIPYLKFVGQQAVAAAGLDEHEEDPMARVAAFAVAVRERLTHLFDAIGRDAEFKIGLGFGGCLGCEIGRNPTQFNLWGDAIHSAEIMASSSIPGAIQASEAAYARLHHDFLFRPRGSFYASGTGESRTFVLAGQL